MERIKNLKEYGEDNYVSASMMAYIWAGVMFSGDTQIKMDDKEYRDFFQYFLVDKQIDKTWDKKTFMGVEIIKDK